MKQPPKWWQAIWNDPAAVRAYIVYVTATPGMLAGICFMLGNWGWLAAVPALFFVIVGGGLGFDRLEQLARERAIKNSPFCDYGGVCGQEEEGVQG